MVITFPGQTVDEQTAERVRQLAASIDDPRLNKKWKWVEARILVRERDMPVEHVHMWNHEFTTRYPSPAGLPCLERGTICPAGSKLVEISYISRRSGGMGSNYQFDGYFVSLVMTSDLARVVDARIDKAY